MAPAHECRIATSAIQPPHILQRVRDRPLTPDAIGSIDGWNNRHPPRASSSASDGLLRRHIETEHLDRHQTIRVSS
jgi:hypothetical protein